MGSGPPLDPYRLPGPAWVEAVRPSGKYQCFGIVAEKICTKLLILCWLIREEF